MADQGRLAGRVRKASVGDPGKGDEKGDDLQKVSDVEVIVEKRD